MSFFPRGEAGPSSGGSEFLSEGEPHPLDRDNDAHKQLGGAQAGSAESQRTDEEAHPYLPMDEVGRVNRHAQVRGLTTGILAGFLSNFATRHLLNRPQKVATMTGLVIGMTVAYTSSAVNIRSGLRELEVQQIALQKTKSAQSRIPRSTSALASGTHDDSLSMEKLDLRAGQQTEFEGGVGGMYAYRDRAHSTRGDH